VGRLGRCHGNFISDVEIRSPRRGMWAR
jgi:hypothetical protein